MNGISKTKKNINYILFVVFVIFAFLQLNDSDGILWFAIYLIVAGVCLLNNFINISKELIILIAALLLLYSAFHFSQFIEYLQTDNKEEIFQEMLSEKPYIEKSREFLGLLMAAFGILYQLKKTKP